MKADTKYARSGDAHIAYRVFGNGPRDLILVPGTVSHVELYWELPVNMYLLKRLAQFARVIVFDKRGQGLSDRVADLTLDERVGDVLAVMNAAGSYRATIYGWSEGGQMSLMLAATQPERVAGLVLYGAYASIQAPPYSVPPERFELFLGALERHWGEGILVRLNAPSRVKDKAFIEWFGRLERAVASPGAIRALMRANYEIDVRDVLPSIRVPTLILHRADDALVPVAAGRLLAERIPGATFVELPGGDHLLQALDQELLERVVDEVEQFLTGASPRLATEALPPPADVESLDAEDAIAELERYREILAAGDDADGLAGVVARAEAIVAAAGGSWSEAEARFVKAAETFRRHGMVWQEAQTFQKWNQALQADPNRRTVIEKLDATIEMLRPHGNSRRHGAGDARVTVPGDTTAAVSPRAVFRCEGDYWTISWRSNVVRLKEAKGLRYIAFLLARPGCEVFAGTLAAVAPAAVGTVGFRDVGTVSGYLGDSGTVLDAKAREQYRRRIRDLEEELAEAVRLNDTGRAARQRSELESLRHEITAAVGLRGQVRKAGSHAERARLMVTKAIKTAIAKIRARDPALGRHLATSIKTGNCCAYDPGPAPPVVWDL